MELILMLSMMAFSGACLLILVLAVSSLYNKKDEKTNEQDSQADAT